KSKDDLLLNTIVKDIAILVEQPREIWPLSLIRSMADELIEQISVRKIKANLESRWLNLVGYCMRPGFGDGFDEHRIKKLWKIYKTGPVHSNNAQVRSEWWIMWRRVAGGLKPGQQRQFIQDLSSLVLSKKGVKSKISPQEQKEIWMAVANLEYLLVKDKINWGRQLLSIIRSQKAAPQNIWSLSRLGARELLYGPVDRVIPPKEAVSWIKQLMNKEWKNPKPVCSAIAQMSRKTGDRMRDIDREFISEIITYLSQYDFTESDIKFLKQIVLLEKKDESAIFGESLPSGIVLKT
ncbi:molecular chaperone DnaK, partial [Desulfobacterales bacterium HSG17]|nr:molecular chaperone DnaK [Desulfobacterales bacterium HSG17]